MLQSPEFSGVTTDTGSDGQNVIMHNSSDQVVSATRVKQAAMQQTHHSLQPQHYACLHQLYVPGLLPWSTSCPLAFSQNDSPSHQMISLSTT